MYSLLRSAPHPSLPRLIACIDNVSPTDEQGLNANGMANVGGAPARSMVGKDIASPAALAAPAVSLFGSGSNPLPLGGEDSTIFGNQSPNSNSVNAIPPFVFSFLATSGPPSPNISPSPSPTIRGGNPFSLTKSHAPTPQQPATSVSRTTTVHVTGPATHVLEVAQPSQGTLQATANTSGSLLVFPECKSDLHSLIRRRGRLSEDDGRLYFRQIVSAVAHCHAQRIVLGDIRLGKIMFLDSEHKNVVIADMHGAHLLSTADQSMDCKSMSPAYVAPEVLARLRFELAAGKCIDMWALGVVLYVMLVGQYPFCDLHIPALCQKILAGTFGFPAWVSLPARRLISRLLSRDPTLRPSASEVLQDLWLREGSTSVDARTDAKSVEADGPPASPLLDPRLSSSTSSGNLSRKRSLLVGDGEDGLAEGVGRETHEERACSRRPRRRLTRTDGNVLCDQIVPVAKMSDTAAPACPPTPSASA